MNAGSRQQIEHLCSKLAYQFTHIIDMNPQASKVADLFVEEGTFEAPGMLKEGREAIREVFKAREGTDRVSKHVCTNMVINVINEHHATGTCYMTLYKYEPEEETEGPAPLDGPAYVGHYWDEYVHVEGQWMFAKRKAEVIFLKK